MWFVEYFFNFDNTNWHQYIIGNLFDIDDNNEIINKEEFNGVEEGKNIVYKWIDIKDKPKYLKEKLLNTENHFEFIERTEL